MMYSDLDLFWLFLHYIFILVSLQLINQQSVRVSVLHIIHNNFTVLVRCI